MTVINQNSISGITSITAASGSVQIFNSDGSSGSLTDLAGVNVTGVVTATAYKVGAGVTVDASGIHVVGVVTATSFSGDGSALTGIDATQIVTGDTSVQTVDTGSDGTIKFTTDGSERARIDSSGNFGFGTNSPTNKIHSYASNNAARTDHIRLQNDGADNGTESAITFTANSASEQACIFSTKDATGPSLNFEISGAQMGRFTNNGQFIVGTVPSSLPTSTLVVEGASDGTDGNPTLHFSRKKTIGSATGLGLISFGKNNLQGARIYGISNGTWSEGSSHPTDIVFETVPNSSTTLTTAAKILKGGELQFNSGYGSVATAYGVRAWVNFDGTGTVSIRNSGNVSSITDNGTGDYMVNFTNHMPDINYSVAGSALYDASTNSFFLSIGASGGFNSYGTALCRVRSTSYNGSSYDASVVNAIFIR